MKDFKGRVAVITGAASGIGYSLADRLAREGMHLVLVDIDQQGLDKAVADFSHHGVEILARQTDVADSAAVASLADEVYARFGSVHFLCNNAAILTANRFRPVWEFSVDEWKKSIDVNVIGVINGINSFVPRMLQGGEPGYVVNTSSIGGLTAGTYSAPYATTKQAVIRITEALYGGLQETSDIGVTAYCPGLVRTPMASPQEGLMSPEEAVEILLEGVRERKLYVLTSDAYDGAIRDRVENIVARRNPEPVDVRTLNAAELSKRRSSQAAGS